MGCLLAYKDPISFLTDPIPPSAKDLFYPFLATPTAPHSKKQQNHSNIECSETQAAPLYPILPKVPLVMVSREVYKCMLGQPATSMING
jgi:hypothetical protein